MKKEKPPAAPSNAEPQGAVSFRSPPRPRGGEEVIALEAYREKVLAIRVVDRYKVETRFGPRHLSVVQIVLEGSKEHIQGALFQAYFQTLDTGLWYLGTLKKIKRGANESWVLEPVLMHGAATASIRKTISKMAADPLAAESGSGPQTDVPF